MKSNEAADRDGIADDVLIRLEKKAGEDRVIRRFEASSMSAALNGLAMLIADYVEASKTPAVQVLYILSQVVLVLCGQESASAQTVERGAERSS